MPGPLAQLYALLNKENDADYGAHGHGMDRAMFNSRLSKMGTTFPTGRMPDDDGGPIDLSAAEPNDIDARMLEADPIMGMRRGLPPRPFRDPEQGGPAPPPRDSLASMYGRGR